MDKLTKHFEDAWYTTDQDQGSIPGDDECPFPGSARKPSLDELDNDSEVTNGSGDNHEW